METKQSVINYVKSLNDFDRKKLSEMLKHNVICCAGIAKDLKIDVDSFNAELRRIFI